MRLYFVITAIFYYHFKKCIYYFLVKWTLTRCVDYILCKLYYKSTAYCESYILKIVKNHIISTINFTLTLIILNQHIKILATCNHIAYYDHVPERNFYKNCNFSESL